VNQFDEPVTLSEPESTNAAFRAELKTVKPGKEFELHVSTVTPLEALARSTLIPCRICANQASANCAFICVDPCHPWLKSISLNWKKTVGTTKYTK